MKVSETKRYIMTFRYYLHDQSRKFTKISCDEWSTACSMFGLFPTIFSFSKLGVNCGVCCPDEKKVTLFTRSRFPLQAIFHCRTKLSDDIWIMASQTPHWSNSELRMLLYLRNYRHGVLSCYCNLIFWLPENYRRFLGIISNFVKKVLDWLEE